MICATIMTTGEDLREQGILLFNQHDYESAARTFQRAKDAYNDEGNLDMAAEMKVNIGLVHRSLGELQQALDVMQEALRYFEENDDKLRTAQVLGNLGGVYQALNDKEQAEMSYRQAANLFKEIGEEIMYSDTMIALGVLQVRDGKLMTGAATYQIALENRENLTGTQKIIQRLSKFINRLAGTPTP